LVSLPTFDNNLLSRRIDPEELQALLDDPGKPLVNHAIAEIYPPGSTFKQVTGLAALQEGVATPNTTIVSHGYITVANQYDPSIVYVFRDWAPLGRLNFYQGLAMSSDVYFYYLAGGKEDEEFKGLGATSLAQYARSFGLGSPTGIDVPGEAAGLVPDPLWKEEVIGESWVTGDTYNFGIGQGYIATTPLQMLNVAAAIANGGWLVRPHVAKAIVDNDGTVIASVDGRTDLQVPVDLENLAIMREAMRQSVDWGVAKTAQVRGVTVAGKTGTAEFGEEKEDGTFETHGWFVGFAPYEDPQVAIVVFVQQGAGGSTAAPAAARILDYLFHQSALVEGLGGR
ncbi:MAG: penicillin-binding transpeptidase domain-containing protein, partial [Dehalococcoidia bacterium]